jgi:hypothetical protein
VTEHPTQPNPLHDTCAYVPVAAKLPPELPQGVSHVLVDLIIAAALLSISPRLLAELVASDEVPHVRVNRRLLFRPESLRAWAASREKGGRS